MESAYYIHDGLASASLEAPILEPVNTAQGCYLLDYPCASLQYAPVYIVLKRKVRDVIFQVALT